MQVYWIVIWNLKMCSIMHLSANWEVLQWYHVIYCDCQFGLVFSFFQYSHEVFKLQDNKNLQQKDTTIYI